MYLGSAKENSRDEGSEEKQFHENEKINNNVYKEPQSTPGYLYIGGEQASLYLGSSESSQKVGGEGKLEGAKEEKKNEHSLIGGGAGDEGELYLSKQIMAGVNKAELPMRVMGTAGSVQFGPKCSERKS